MFNWFPPPAPAEAQPVVPNFSPPSLAEQILQACETPITLGTLSDRLALPYHQLSPTVTELIGQGKLKTTFLSVGGLNCIHYARSER
ncbi:MAG: hypothetical protein DCF22_00725 [Leptolyngbya sp.]|nr:MAG: hypothetical protein DCF22_00725 [Leptolyngbya sp.]